ncbi:MAG: hypothetical protein AB1410_10110 [Acidobacteriota bacterium]
MEEIDKNIIKSCEENGYISIIGFDADKIQEYVFATSKPIEIGGASEIVRELNKDQIFKWIKEIDNMLTEENVIYAHGGGGLIISPVSNADKIIKKIEDEFHKASVTASLTAEKIEVQVKEIENNFSTIFKHLSEKLRFKKDQKLAISSYSIRIPPYFKRCGSCGVYPVTQYDYKYRDEEERYICDSCFNKRKKFREKILSSGLTLENIVKENKENSEEDYLAIIYADGHNTGSILETFTLPEFREFPEKLYEISREILEDTINELKLKHRYIAPVIGGDDLVLLLPAKKSILAIRKIIDKFRTQIKFIDKLKHLSLDIGLVIASHHFPIRYLFQYVNALMKNAKRLAYQKDEKFTFDYFDYMVIKGGSPLNLSIEELRRIELLREISHIEYRLTSKPYKWEEFNDKIIKSLEALNRFPSSQLYIVLEHLLEHPEVAKLNIMYQVARSDEWQKKLEEITGNFYSSEWESFFIKRISPTQYETPFLDLMELYKRKVEV